MRMHFEGAPDITADRDTVWRALLDPNFVARAAPSIQSVEPIDATHYKVIAGLGIGPLKLSFKLDVELFDITEPESARMRVRGKAPGSTMDATTSFRLADGGPGTIRLHWTVNADVGGTVASVGARLLEGTARRLTEEFWQDFANLVTREAAR
jgi:carbon monoxide dehydrogenase subunit G